MKKITSVIIYLLLPLSVFAANNTDTLAFKVSGNCEMCKENIEEALDTKGIKSANWNMETGMITVIYYPEKITEEKIHELIAEAGYDTDKKKSNPDVYKKLPKCCQYNSEGKP